MASAYDSSDEEERLARHDIQPLKIDKLKLPDSVNLSGAIYISGLPGCWFRKTHRNLYKDMEHLTSLGITDAIVLLTKGEMRKYRSPSLLSVYAAHGICPHYHPFEDGSAPDIDFAITLLRKMVDQLAAGRTLLVHCVCGYGRAGVVCACLLQWLCDSVAPEQSLDAVRVLRGNSAVQTVKQYNFVMDFRHLLVSERARERSVSR